MSDLPTLYRLGGVPQGWPIHPDDLIQDGWLVPVTEPLLTRVEAANDPEVIEAVMSQSDRNPWYFRTHALKVADDE